MQATSGQSQTDKGTVSGAENKFLSGRDRERERERERAGYFMVVPSVIRLLDTGYVHGLDHLASFFEKLSKLIFLVRMEIKCYKTPGLDHLG